MHLDPKSGFQFPAQIYRFLWILMAMILLGGCGDRPSGEPALGAANGSSSSSSYPPLHNPDQPSPNEAYGYTRPTPTTSTSASTSSSESSTASTSSSTTSSSSDSTTTTPSSPGSLTGPTTTELPRFGEQKHFGYWKMQSTQKYSSTNHIFIIAIYDDEIWHHRYDNIRDNLHNCFPLARNYPPFELMWVEDTALTVKLQTVNGTATSFTDYAHNASEDTLFRWTFVDGELYDETVFYRIWSEITREEMLDCEFE